MLDIKNENFKLDITYSNSKSRPSKTLLNTDLYLSFLKCKIDPYNRLKEYTLEECIGKNFELFNIESNIITINEKIYNFIDYKHYFCEVLRNLTRNCIIEINNIYEYTQLQFILILSKLFDKIYITTTLYKNCVYIICNSRNDVVINIKKSYIKDFNIIAPKYLIEYIKDYNNSYFKNIIKLNKIIDENNIQDITSNIELLNNYHLSFITKKNSCSCSCKCKNITYNIFNKLYICIDCYSLHKIDHFLIFDHSAAASLNTAL